MGCGEPGFGELPTERRVGVVDAEEIVVPAVDPQVDDGDVGPATGGGGGSSNESLRCGQGHDQPQPDERASSMSVPCHWWLLPPAVGGGRFGGRGTWGGPVTVVTAGSPRARIGCGP